MQENNFSRKLHYGCISFCQLPLLDNFTYIAMDPDIVLQLFLLHTESRDSSSY